MKLYERFGDGGFHTCISTTFGIDFDAYENIVLPRLRGANCSNNLLLVDARMLTYALDGASVLPAHAGRQYTVTGVKSQGIFHPKIILHLGRTSGRAVISSANMTACGLAGNLELAGEITCTPEASGERSLIAAVWEYLSGLLVANGEAVGHQQQWLLARTPWLFDTEPSSDVVTLADGAAAAFLTASGNGITGAIGSRFARLVDGEIVERLVVLSPYWDDDLAALGALVTTLAPRKVAILIDQKKGLFPARAASSLESSQIFDLHAFGKNRFVHAKAIIAETDKADHVLFGSANCTVAALGSDNYAGANHEACLYRRLPSGSILAALGLDRIINESVAIDPDDLPAYRAEELLPLAETALRSPGQFECAYDTLFWRPAMRNTVQASVELLDAAGRLLPIQLAPVSGDGENRRSFQMSGAKARPAFARLRFPGGDLSAPAIVMIVDVLRETVREARGKRGESAVLQLSDETEEGLWLWEVLNELETVEHAQQQEASAAVKRQRQTTGGDEAQVHHYTLTYDHFIAGRRLRSDHQVAARNSLAGSELSLVRNFLNRVLTIGDEASGNSLPDEGAITRGFDLQDETSDGAAMLEHGEERPATLKAGEQAAASKEEERRRAVRARASRDQIVRAVAAFNARLKEKVEQAGLIDSVDVLRLRAMLVIIAAAGQSNKGAGSRANLQVIPLNTDTDSWPRLMGQLLFTFFGGNCPVIRHLKIEAVHDQLPDDILESWATALWSIQACICAVRDQNVNSVSLLKMLTRLCNLVYARTGLHPDELAGEGIQTIFSRLNDRFSGRLGLSPGNTQKAHTATISAVHKVK